MHQGLGLNGKPTLHGPPTAPPFHGSLLAIWFAHYPYDGALMPKPLVLEIFTDHI